MEHLQVQVAKTAHAKGERRECPAMVTETRGNRGAILGPNAEEPAKHQQYPESNMAAWENRCTAGQIIYGEVCSKPCCLASSWEVGNHPVISSEFGSYMIYKWIRSNLLTGMHIHERYAQAGKIYGGAQVLARL